MQIMRKQLEHMKESVKSDLIGNILPFWYRTERMDGFVGGMRNDLSDDKESPIGFIMVSRLLWTYSRAFRKLGEKKHIEFADRIFAYLIEHFEDPDHGGFFWMLDPSGNPLETKKQTYGQAFAVYALSEYYMASGNEDSLTKAMNVFRLIEKNCWQENYSGYWEALDRSWEMMEDVRLSSKDLNAPFSMNTHLHLMEAYANLLIASRESLVKEGCVRVLDVMTKRILLSEKNRFGLFYSKDWELLDETISPGHDIEGSWLIWETAEILDDAEIMNSVRPIVLAMAEYTLENGVDDDGGILNEYEEEHKKELGKDWWPQAEAVVGFLNAYQLSGDRRFLSASLNAWNYIQDKIIDPVNGEWFEGRNFDGTLDQRLKAGPWKSCYHNGRMGFEVIERIENIFIGNTHE